MGEGASSEKESQKKAFIYLLLTLGIGFLCGILAIIFSGETGKAIYSFFQKTFTAIPVIAAFLTRLITKDKSDWNFSLRVWKNAKILLFSALVPGAAVLIGAGIYYLIFPHELYGNIRSLYNFCVQYGLPDNISVNKNTITITTLIIWIISVFAIPIHLLELGEELGWRGYLLPQLMSFMSVRKSVLISGLLWGLMHSPLIYFGFNYGSAYWGAPYTGILMMMIVCISMGIWMSYTMIKTGNCMYSAIIHGAFNVAADIQILSATVNRPLLGPAPTGIMGMSIILLISILLFFTLPKTKNTTSV